MQALLLSCKNASNVLVSGCGYQKDTVCTMLCRHASTLALVQECKYYYMLLYPKKNDSDQVQKQTTFIGAALSHNTHIAGTWQAAPHGAQICASLSNKQPLLH